jgi:hypothetical protein
MTFLRITKVLGFAAFTALAYGTGRAGSARASSTARPGLL